MVVLSFEQHARRARPSRVAAETSPNDDRPSFERLPLDSFAQGRPLPRAVLESVVTTSVLIGLSAVIWLLSP